MYYLQVHAFYVTLPPDTPLAVTLSAGGERVLPLSGFAGIDAASSPLRFRACATLDDPAAAEGALPVEAPEPLLAPGWFDCFDARSIALALARGEARAVLSRREVARGVDRVLAIHQDGRVFAWHQLNGTLED
jgi:hypothetical protein